MYRHFAAVAECADLPIVLYNIPSRTGRNVEPETVERLAALGPIVAVKEASGSLDQVSELLVRTDLTILSGDDSLDPAHAGGGGRGGRLGRGEPGASRCHGPDRGVTRRAGSPRPGGRTPGSSPCAGTCWVWPPIRSRSRRPWPSWAAAAGEVRLPLCPLDERSLAVLRGSLIRYGLLTQAA